MADEFFRQQILKRIDDSLDSMFVRGENRKFLNALRSFTAAMADEEIERFKICMSRSDTPASSVTACECSQEVKDAVLATAVAAEEVLLKSYVACEWAGCNLPDTNLKRV